MARLVPVQRSHMPHGLGVGVVEVAARAAAPGTSVRRA